MTYLACLLVGVLLTVAAFALAMRRGLRPLAAAAAYRGVAWRLGLEADTRGAQVHGLLAGRRLFIGELHGTEGRPKVRALLDLRATLAEGLLVRRRERSVSVRRRRFTQPITTADPSIDRVFHVYAADESRLRVLLGDDVRDALLRLAERFPDIELTDHHLKVRLRSPVTSERRLLALIEAMQAVVDAVERRRSSMGPPSDVPVDRQAWADAAAELGVGFDLAYPQLSGQLGARSFRALVVRGVDGPVGWMRLRFAEHPPVGLRLVPQRRPDGGSGQDVLVGDADFDDAFVVQIYDPAVARELLTAEVRGALCRLAAKGSVTLTDDGIDLSGLPAEPDALVGAANELSAVADALGW